MLQGDWDLSPDPCKDLFVYGRKPFPFWSCQNLQWKEMLCEVRLLLKDAEASGVMNCQLLEIAYQLLGAQVRPHTLLWKKLLEPLFLANSLPTHWKVTCRPSWDVWGSGDSPLPSTTTCRGPTIHRMHYQQPDFFNPIKMKTKAQEKTTGNFSLHNELPWNWTF